MKEFLCKFNFRSMSYDNIPSSSEEDEDEEEDNAGPKPMVKSYGTYGRRHRQGYPQQGYNNR